MADQTLPAGPSDERPRAGSRGGALEDTGWGGRPAAEAATVGRRDGRRVISRLAPSGAGPGAGESEMVRVEAPVKGQEDDDVPRHPTLRDHPGPT